MRHQLVLGTVATLLGGTIIGLSSVHPISAPAEAKPIVQSNANEVACNNLSGTSFGEVGIVSARVQTAKAGIDDARRPDMTGEPHGAPVQGLPAFCRVIGSIRPEARSDVKFEVWLPMQGWNGRLFGANNGGFAGSIRYDDLAAAISNGAIGAATDSGHTNAMGLHWAKDRPDLLKDYGWRSIHVTTVAAKEIAKRFYGRSVAKSYFVGCSNGGRMGLMEASRFPEDYDGIVAGAPAVSWTGGAMSGLNIARAQKSPGTAIRPEQAAFLQAEVLKQCDMLDGQNDGIVVDPKQCRFDYSRLACGTASSAQCFSQPQIATLQTIVAGPHDTAGHRVYPGFPLTGSEVSLGNAGWDRIIMSSRGSNADILLADFVAKPFATSDTFNFDTDPAKMRVEPGADLDPQPDLQRFFARGGKLIMWHGWADPILSPLATMDFYKATLARGGQKARQGTRLFMLPAVQHCSGGAGADAIGGIGAAPSGTRADRSVAAAVVDWVEQGRVPKAIIGTHGQGEISAGAAPEGRLERLHCAWPALPVLRPGANPDKGASYICRAAGGR